MSNEIRPEPVEREMREQARKIHYISSTGMIPCSVPNLAKGVITTSGEEGVTCVNCLKWLKNMKEYPSQKREKKNAGCD